MRRTRLRHTKKYWPTPHYQAQLVTSGQNGFFSGTHSISPTPLGVALFSVKKTKNVTSRWYNPLQNSSGMKFPSSPYINFQKKYSYEDKVRYKKSAQDSPEHSTRCAQLSSGQSAHLFGKINYAGPRVPFFAHISQPLIPHLRCGGILYYIILYYIILYYII